MKVEKGRTAQVRGAAELKDRPRRKVDFMAEGFGRHGVVCARGGSHCDGSGGE